jgi:hypothetical protein
VGGVDNDGPALFVVEPSGVYYGYHGAAVGKGRQIAKTELEKLNLKELTVRQAVIEAARIIYLVHDDDRKRKISSSRSRGLAQRPKTPIFRSQRIYLMRLWRRQKKRWRTLTKYLYACIVAI